MTNSSILGLSFALLQSIKKSHTNNFLSLERLGEYLYKATFDSIPDYKEINVPVGGGCSSFVFQGKLFRNLDWNYDNTAEFRVICKDFEGMSFISGVEDGNLDWEKISQTPYHINDGVNKDGIMISSHVLFNDWNYAGSGNKDKDITLLPYFVMTNLHSMNDISSVLSDYLANIKIPTSLANLGYLMQYMVTDGTTTYVILPPESASGSYVLVDATHNPKLTNFRWVADKTVDRSALQTHPTGVERWNAIDNLLDTAEGLRFTKAYEENTRLSEFIGIDGTTKDSTDEELEEIYNRVHSAYLTRTRDGVLWQTVHSVVYADKAMDQLYVQEDWSKNYIVKNFVEQKEVVIVESGGSTTILGKSVPTLTEDQIKEIYNYIMADKCVVLVSNQSNTSQSIVVEARDNESDMMITLLIDSSILVTYNTNGGDVEISGRIIGKNVEIDIGNYQYIYEGYTLPAIEKSVLDQIFLNIQNQVAQQLKWTVLGVADYRLMVVSCDSVLGNYSIDLLVHNKYHCEYVWNENTSGIVNPNVASHLVTTISASSTDSEIPTAKAVYDFVTAHLS